MSSDHGRYWDFTLSLQDAETVSALLEQRFEVDPNASDCRLARAQEAVSDACWLARWLGEDPRMELAEDEIDCLLTTLRSRGEVAPLIAVRSQLERVLQRAPKFHDSVAV